MDDLVKATAVLVRALAERDGNTSAHSSRTSTLALELGKVCRLTSAELATLGLAAQLHDIGKIGVPDRILLKPGRLDGDELELMRSHPKRGYDILMAVPDPHVVAVADVVLHHHEAFDGMGYPNQLKGEAIPVSSRIVAIVDSYDALASDRPYKKPKTHQKIMHILFEEQGGKYDPYLRTKFAALIEASAHKATGT
ncbi:MAG TPA: HD domain-containing phosphohydrolase [Casimicrobiaceae bacterium]|nr:HD domain-containing phosphohydrolase [Casimicrobiaceae bacterium]